MSRRFKVLDGTIDNVGCRIVHDYTKHIGECSTHVGAYAVSQLEEKLDKPQFKKLGFTDDTLTIPMGDVDYVDTLGFDELFSNVVDTLYLDSKTDLAFTHGIYNNNELQRIYIKANMHKCTIMNYRERGNIMDNNSKVYRDMLSSLGLPTTDTLPFLGKSNKTLNGSVLSIITYQSLNDFRGNKPCDETFGMKPSRWLKKYVEHLIPGITDKYSAILSSINTRKAYLTIDPNIMLNCSESATFSSCFRFDGEYHMSAQRFLNGLETAMMVSFNDKGEINYRNWVFINDTSTRVTTLNAYSDSDPNIIGKAMKKQLRLKILGSGFSLDRDNKGVEFEPSGSSYIDPMCTAFNKSDLPDWCIDSGYALSPYDGSITEEAELHSSPCACCDNHIGDEDAYEVYDICSEIIEVCQSCFEEYYCTLENEDHHHIDNVTRVNDGYYVLTDNIHDEHVEYCYEWYHIDACTTIHDGSTVPDFALHANYTLIDDEYYYIDDVYYSCITERYYLTAEEVEVLQEEQDNEEAS